MNRHIKALYKEILATADRQTLFTDWTLVGDQMHMRVMAGVALFGMPRRWVRTAKTKGKAHHIACSGLLPVLEFQRTWAGELRQHGKERVAEATVYVEGTTGWMIVAYRGRSLTEAMEVFEKHLSSDPLPDPPVRYRKLRPIKVTP